MNSSKLYVGNLPFSSSDQTLLSMFSECGTVESAKVITDRDTGRGKGFAFVEMSSSDEASKAIEKFNGFEIEGRSMIVNEAKPRETSRKDNSHRGGRRW